MGQVLFKDQKTGLQISQHVGQIIENRRENYFQLTTLLAWITLTPDEYQALRAHFAETR